jgi:predicted DNA-binding transcriptional regulator YafY
VIDGVAVTRTTRLFERLAGRFGACGDEAPPRASFTAHEAAVLIAAGRFLAEMRVLPFTDSLASALEKVRRGVPSSLRAEVDPHLATLTFVGVPARPAAPGVRGVLERAWLEGVPVAIRYAGANGTGTRRVRIRSVVMERRETLVNALDLDKNEDRQFTLDRIDHAALVTTARDSTPHP